MKYLNKKKGLVSPGIKSAVLAVGMASAFALLGFSLTYDVEQPHWEKEKLADSSVGFVQLEVGKKKVHVVHRNSGVEYFGRAKGFLREKLQPEWKKQVIDGREKAGSYMSMAMKNGDPIVSYQYASIGEEEVKLAELENGEWKVKDNLAKSKGRNTGMHSEVTGYRDSSLVFYTDDSTQDFFMAEVSGEVSRETLEDDAGFITDAENCNGKVQVAYATRNNSMKLGEYDGSWSSRDLNTTATSLDLETGKTCEPVIVYHSDPDDRVKLWTPSGEETLAKSQFTRISADKGENLEYLYTRRNLGLEHGIKGENTRFLERNREAGKYHDIEIENGNRYVAYTNGSELIYAEYDTTGPDFREKARKSAQAVSALAIVSLLLIGWRKEILPLKRFMVLLREKYES